MTLAVLVALLLNVVVVGQPAGAVPAEPAKVVALPDNELTLAAYYSTYTANCVGYYADTGPYWYLRMSNDTAYCPPWGMFCLQMTTFPYGVTKPTLQTILVSS
ncbi:MAG: hypothetical protein QOJ19_4831 [Acidimicrobiia bacterium]|jgi:hypothetical protein|nr:hypothetical protein [Acidimicrobiia bacterium]